MGILLGLLYTPNLYIGITSIIQLIVLIKDLSRASSKRQTIFSGNFALSSI